MCSRWPRFGWNQSQRRTLACKSASLPSGIFRDFFFLSLFYIFSLSFFTSFALPPNFCLCFLLLPCVLFPTSFFTALYFFPLLTFFPSSCVQTCVEGHHTGGDVYSAGVLSRGEGRALCFRLLQLKWTCPQRDVLFKSVHAWCSRPSGFAPSTRRWMRP